MKKILKKVDVLALCALIFFTAIFAIGQAPTSGPQRDPLTADQVFEGVRKDIGDCSIEKSTAQAALKVENAYSRKLEERIKQLEKELTAAKPPKPTN